VKPVKRKVVVRQGELVPLDISWSAELAETETTVIVEERHMTKPDSTQTGTVVSADTSAKVATQRDYQDIALQIAGTVDVNGGGNPQIKGGNLIMNKWLVDGLDITDPLTNTFSANINFDSIASIEVITGGMEAQYNSLGGVINLITNGGSDEWHVDSSLYVGNAAFAAKGQYGAQLFQGQVPLSRTPAGPTQSYQANVNVGGPLVKHKLWFNVSLEYDYTEGSTPAGPPLNAQSPPRRFNGVLARLKLTWAPNDKHRVTLSLSGDPSFISNVDTSTANRRLPIAQDYQEQGGAFAILQWDWFINKNINTNVQTGFVFNHIFAGSQGLFAGIDNNGSEKNFSPLNATYSADQPQHINQDDGSIWYQGSSAATYDKRYRFQFDPSVSLRGQAAGFHDAKIGLQLQYIADTFDVIQTGKGVSYTDSGGGPLESGLCNEATGTGGCFLKTITGNYNQKYDGFSIGGYLQDRWKPLKRLTVVPGIRFDYGITHNSGGQIASNVFGVGPRLGVLVDLTGDQKTIFSAFYGRANDVSNLLTAAFASPAALSQTLLWNPTKNKFDTVIAASGGARGYLLDPTGPAPHTDEVTVSLRREVFTSSVATVDYTYKRVSNMWDLQEVNRVWDPSGFRQLTDAMGNPIYKDPSNPQSVFRFTTNHAAIREYQGVDFSVESRPTPNWDIYVAYTLAFLYGSAGEEYGGQINGTPGPFFNPRQTHLWDGFLPEDVRHQLKVRASYNTHGFNAGVFVRYQTGAPLSHQYFEFTDGAYQNLRSPTGTDPAKPNDPRAFAEFRLPDIVQLDLRASYDFHALIKQHLILIADLFNVFNARTPVGIEQQDLPTFGTSTVRQQPLLFQLAARYIY
jgi:hypothetical protein